MKKIFIILFNFFFIIIFYSISFNVNSYSILTDYYSNLNSNISENVNGTCTYVATTMLLSYYDTYLNDDIIPEQYDTISQNYNVSPGVYRENLSMYSYDDTLYREKLLELSDCSLQSKLFQIANSLAIYSYAITIQNRIDILNSYFRNVCGFWDSNYSFSTCVANNTTYQQQLIKSFIKSEIDDGYPVIVNMDFYNNNPNELLYNHSFIIYDYDNNNGFYGNFGDPNNPNNDSFYLHSYDIYYFSGAFSIHFNLPHKHSNNYCYQNDNSTHLAVCGCGYSEEERHKYHNDNNSGICDLCNNISSITTNIGIELDPTNSITLGTYVNYYGGQCYDTDLVPGYTRIAYLSGDSPSQSRLDYDWYSSNENILEVTKYGTILAKSVGSATITAVYKYNPTMIGNITIDIIDDYKNIITYINFTFDTRIGNQNGTEVTILNNPICLSTIHSGYTRALCFNSNNNFPSLTNFNIRSTNTNAVEYLDYGYLLGKQVNEPTVVEIRGESKYNVMVKIAFNVTILP